eukprot:GFYU01042273.1.p1 GENE.GFYU01042273.1~~GFYU01042273.1.p1  ORF type:complete len:224 (-),score=34.97 GFYU01042273.1:4-675(-)
MLPAGVPRAGNPVPEMRRLKEPEAAAEGELYNVDSPRLNRNMYDPAAEVQEPYLATEGDEDEEDTDTFERTEPMTERTEQSDTTMMISEYDDSTYSRANLEYGENDDFIEVVMKWTLSPSLPNCPSSRFAHTMTVIHPWILVYGGYDCVSVLDSLCFFNYVKGRWEDVDVEGKPPGPLSGHAVDVVGATMCIFGGFNGKKDVNDFYTFETNKLKWTQHTWSEK